MLASWLEQRAKNMELSEKVRNKRWDSTRRLRETLAKTLFSFKKYWDRVLKPVKLFFLLGRLASKCFATCECPVECIKVGFRECIRKRSCHTCAVCRSGIALSEERYMCVKFLSSVNFWFKFVTWREYLTTTFMCFSGRVLDQVMEGGSLLSIGEDWHFVFALAWFFRVF